jgi:hypothetical protein
MFYLDFDEYTKVVLFDVFLASFRPFQGPVVACNQIV